MSKTNFTPLTFNREIKRQLTKARKNRYLDYDGLVDFIRSTGNGVQDLSLENKLRLLTFSYTNVTFTKFADEIIKNINVTERDEQGRTALAKLLIIAGQECTSDFTSINMRKLLNRGADINSTDNDGTTLCIHSARAAVRLNQRGVRHNIFSEISDWLPNNVNDTDKNGDTALMIASKNLPESFPVIKALLKMGADVSTQDQEQKMVFDYVESIPPSSKYLKANLEALLNDRLMEQVPSPDFNNKISARIEKIKNDPREVPALINDVRDQSNGMALVSMENKVRILGIHNQTPELWQFKQDIISKIPNQRDVQGRSPQAQILHYHIERNAELLNEDDQHSLALNLSNLVRHEQIFRDITPNDRDNDGVTVATHFLNAAIELEAWDILASPSILNRDVVNASDEKWNTILLVTSKALASGLYKKENPVASKMREEETKNIVYKLIEAGVDVNVKDSAGKSTLDYLPFERKIDIIINLPEGEARNKMLDNIDFNYVDATGKTALTHFILGERISRNPEEDSLNYSALITAALARGANVDTLDKDGCSPFLHAMNAARKRYEPTLINLMLAKNPNVNLRSNLYNKLTALEMVMCEDYPDKLKFVSKLIDNGADVNLLNEMDQSPLLLSVMQQDEDIVKRLLQAGAHVNVVDKEYGHSPLSAAAFHGQEKIVQLLLEHSADYVDDTASDLYDPPQAAREITEAAITISSPSSSLVSRSATPLVSSKILVASK